MSFVRFIQPFDGFSPTRFPPPAVLTVLLYVCFIIVSTGCDGLYRMLDKEGAQEKKLIGESDPYVKNPTIEEIQKLLKVYGYSPGSVDGVMGGHTRIALAKFQTEHGLKVTRYADNETWAMLKVYRDLGLVENGEIHVKNIQALLKNAGFYKGMTDGKFGPQTKQAILDFQKKHGLKTDGKIGYETLTQLSKYRETPSTESPALSSKD